MHVFSILVILMELLGLDTVSLVQHRCVLCWRNEGTTEDTTSTYTTCQPMTDEETEKTTTRGQKN